MCWCCEMRDVCFVWRLTMLLVNVLCRTRRLCYILVLIKVLHRWVSCVWFQSFMPQSEHFIKSWKALQVTRVWLKNWKFWMFLTKLMCFNCIYFYFWNPNYSNVCVFYLLSAKIWILYPEVGNVSLGIYLQQTLFEAILITISH